MINTVIFDVDGTLLNTEIVYMRAWAEAGAARGFQVPWEALVETRAVNAAVAKARFQSYCGEDFPYEQLRVERVEISERLIRQIPVRELLMPHVHEALQWLKDQGYTLAAASSTDHAKTVEHLEHAGLLHYFSVIIGGDMVQKGKPEPDIFLKAAQQVGFAPEQCLVVGDSPADVFAAAAAGIPVVLIPDQVPVNEQTLPLSYKVLGGLDQLAETVQELEGAVCSIS